MELTENVNQYFEYIKSIYLSEFDRYLSKDVKNDIASTSNVIELRDEVAYKTHVHDNKITYNLDLKRYKHTIWKKDLRVPRIASA